MFGSGQYYTLVAGLRELTPEGGEKGFDAAAVYGEIRRELTPADRRAAGLVWSLADIYGLGRERIEELYALCAASRCAYLREWARFDRNLRNVIAAGTARTKGREVAPSLLSIEGDEVAVTLGRSTAADFNLRGELDFVERLLAALDTASVVEKERAIDMIRWDKADALVEESGDAFGVPAILAYVIKVSIIGRWSALDPVTGREMYNKLVNSINRYDKR
jgi:hypothetical protein